MILLDTNVLSELMRPRPHTNVVAWVARHDARVLYTSAITEAETLHGLALLPDGKRSDALVTAFTSLLDTLFAGRVLPFDRRAAARYAEVAAHSRTIGRPMAQNDAMIAAIAGAADMTLATRNIRDFSASGIVLVDPFEPA